MVKKARYSHIDDIVDAPLYRQAAEIIGLDAANGLQMTFGGRRLFIPRTIGQHHPISVAIGLDAARRLADEMGGQRFDVPLSLKRQALLRECLKSGLGSQATANRIGCTRRAVQYAKAKLGATPPLIQPKLL